MLDVFDVEGEIGESTTWFDSDFEVVVSSTCPLMEQRGKTAPLVDMLILCSSLELI